MSDCLTALDKLNRVCPVGVGLTWRRFFAECVIKVTGSEATHACKGNQLCVGFKSGTDGEVHKVQYIWEANSNNENWGFLPVDADNTFNKDQ